MAEPTAKFTLSAAQKIADVVHSFNAEPNDRTGSRSIRRSYSNRGFWAMITCYVTLAPNRFKYSWVEMARVKNDDFIIKSNARMGDACQHTYAINSIEINNEASGVQGNGQTVGSGNYLQPVGGFPIVWMVQDFPVKDTTLATASSAEATVSNNPVYTFAYENAMGPKAPKAITCNCTEDGSESFTSHCPKSVG